MLNSTKIKEGFAKAKKGFDATSEKLFGKKLCVISGEDLNACGQKYNGHDITIFKDHWFVVSPNRDSQNAIYKELKSTGFDPSLVYPKEFYERDFALNMIEPDKLKKLEKTYRVDRVSTLHITPRVDRVSTLHITPVETASSPETSTRPDPKSPVQAPAPTEAVLK